MLAKLLKQLKATGERGRKKKNVTSILPIIMHQLPPPPSLPLLLPVRGLSGGDGGEVGGGGGELMRLPVPSFPLTLTSGGPFVAEVCKRLSEPLGVGGQERIPLTWSSFV